MNAVSWLLCSLLAVGAAACSSTTPSTKADSAEAAPGPPGEAAAAAPHSGSAPAELSYEGVLHYKALPMTKSVEAYLGVDLTLERGDGEAPLPLAGSAIWPHDRLIALDGKRIAVDCVMQPGAAPRAEESAPMGPDGAPLPRPAKCAVQRLVER